MGAFVPADGVADAPPEPPLEQAASMAVAVAQVIPTDKNRAR
jgi:hypothetical protein